jgi:hypothetical protein
LSIKTDIKRDRLLAKARQGERGVFKADGNGSYALQSTGRELIYCSVCKGPVVDSPQARKTHAARSPRCAEAIC